MSGVWAGSSHLLSFLSLQAASRGGGVQCLNDLTKLKHEKMLRMFLLRTQHTSGNVLHTESFMHRTPQELWQITVGLHTCTPSTVSHLTPLQVDAGETNKSLGDSRWEEEGFNIASDSFLMCVFALSKSLSIPASLWRRLVAIGMGCPWQQCKIRGWFSGRHI